MSISTVQNRIAYQGNGTSAVFAFPFEVHRQTDLAVFTYNSSATTNGIILAQVLNTNYSFSGTPNASGIYPSGANIIFNSSPNAQTQVVIFRSSIVTNEFFLGQNNPIPSVPLNNELNYLTLLAQRAQDIGTRAVRLPDGFPGTFDTSLPENISQSVGKRLIVNSTGNGWTFDETLGAYIQNTIVYAATNSSIVSLPGAAAGKLLISNGSSAPSWGDFVLGSSGLSGVLQQINGGTGTGSSFTQGLIIFQGASGFSESPFLSWDDTNKSLGVGQPWVVNLFNINGQSFTSPAVLSANSSVGSAIMLGHRHSDSAVIGSRIYLVRSRGTQMAPLVVQDGDLISSLDHSAFNGSGYSTAARIRVLVDGTPGLTNMPGLISFETSPGSSNVLVQAMSIGKNQRASFFGDVRLASSVGLSVLYTNGSGVVTSLPFGGAGTVLTSNGSSAPSFQSAGGGGGPTATAVVGTSYTVATTDRNVFLSNSTAWTLNLYDPSLSPTGPQLTVKMLGAGKQPVAVTHSGVVLIYMVAQNESVNLVAANNSWQILSHKIIAGGTAKLSHKLATTGADYGPAVTGGNSFRILNTHDGDTTFCTLTGSASVFIIQPGLYKFNGGGVFFGTNNSVHKIRDLTNELLTGNPVFSGSGAQRSTAWGSIDGILSFNTSTTLALQYRVGNAGITDALGSGPTANSSVVAVLNIEKIG